MPPLCKMHRFLQLKRPLVIGDSFVLTGFKEKDWQEKLG